MYVDDRIRSWSSRCSGRRRGWVQPGASLAGTLVYQVAALSRVAWLGWELLPAYRPRLPSDLFAERQRNILYVYNPTNRAITYQPSASWLILCCGRTASSEASAGKTYPAVTTETFKPGEARSTRVLALPSAGTYFAQTYYLPEQVDPAASSYAGWGTSNTVEYLAPMIKPLSQA